MHTHLIPLVECCVNFAHHYTTCFNLIESVVQFKPKVLAAVGHDRHISRWPHCHLCLSDTAFIARVFCFETALSAVSQMNCIFEFLIRVRSHGARRTRGFD
jgi:hypothetical protein